MTKFVLQVIFHNFIIINIQNTIREKYWNIFIFGIWIIKINLVFNNFLSVVSVQIYEIQITFTRVCYMWKKKETLNYFMRESIIVSKNNNECNVSSDRNLFTFLSNIRIKHYFRGNHITDRTCFGIISFDRIK